MSQIPLKSTENYDHNRVFEHLPRASRQAAKANCKIRCYTSEIKLKRSKPCKAQPPRKSYSYKDIDRYYSFATNPDILVLGCSRPGATTRSYDFIKLDNERHAQELSLLIERARNHPLYLLVDEDNTTTVRQQSTRVSPSDENSAVQISRQGPELELIRRPSVSEHSHHDSVSEKSINEVNEPIIVESNAPDRHSIGRHSSASSSHQLEEINLLQSEAQVFSEPPEVKKKGHPLEDDPLFKEMCANIREGETYDVDMIYVDPESRQAKRDTATGNVYMFVARYLNDDDEEMKEHYGRPETTDFRFVEGESTIACQ